MSLNKEPCRTHSQKFVYDNPLRIVKLKFFLNSLRNEAGDDGGNKNERDEKKKRRMKQTKSVK